MFFSLRGFFEHLINPPLYNFFCGSSMLSYSSRGVVYVGGKRWDGVTLWDNVSFCKIHWMFIYVRPSSFQNLKVNVIFNTRKWMMSRGARRGGGGNKVDEDFFVEGLFLSVGNLFLFKLWASFFKVGGGGGGASYNIYLHLFMRGEGSPLCKIFYGRP